MANPQKKKNLIRANAWVKRSSLMGPHIIFTQIMNGYQWIVDAYVEVLTTFPNGRTEKFQLFDSGSGAPDLTKSDGIYSRYFTAKEEGMYRFDITISDNGNTAWKSDSLMIPASSKISVEPFHRYLTPMVVFVKARDTISAYSTDVGRIGDLRMISSSNERAVIQFTGPDFAQTGPANIETFNVQYEVFYSNHIKDLVDNFETLANKWHSATGRFCKISSCRVLNLSKCVLQIFPMLLQLVKLCHLLSI